jgi:acyl-[acyl-carrier-protein]-phospholipid O-acyltransferase/long-chain-fatty-acid--[acyl-carrier-protein] ligase
MLKTLAKLVLKMFFKLEVRLLWKGKPPERLIVMANHQSFLDPFLVGCFLPFEMTWLVHSTIAAQWHFRLFLKLVPHLVVDAANPMAMKSIVHLVEAGKRVCIFPEGRITVTGSLMKIYDGLAFLRAKTGAELLPVIIDGAVHSRVSRMKHPYPIVPRPTVRVTIYPPVRLPEPDGRTGRQRRRAASDQIRQLLEERWFRAQPQSTIFESFLRASELFGRQAELVEDIRFQPATYGGVLKGALALGRLVSRHAAEGETVGVLMPNAAATVMLLLGMFGGRRVPAMLNYTAGVEGMQSACEVACIKTILTSRTFLEKARLTEKAARLQNVRLIYLEDLRKQFTLLDKLWLMLYAVRRPSSCMRPARPEDPAIVLFTSGSEGKPKGVVLSHGSILANIAQIRSVIEFSNRDKFLVALPMFHSFGLTAGVLTPLVTGARLFLYPSPLHFRMVPEMCYDRDATVIFGTGTFLANYAKRAHPYDFYSVRYALAGAEKLADSVRKTWQEQFGIRILEGYGVTEFSPVVAVNTPYFNRAGTVGKMVPGIEYRLEPIPGIDSGGKLHIRGPNQMLGYLREDKPGLIQQPESWAGQGWYDTGDIVEIEDGYLRIVGRAKRFAKVAGEMVSLEKVEQLAAQAAPGRAHAATLVASERRGETILLFSEDANLRREHLLAAARETGIADVAVPRMVITIDKLPRLGSGKFDYVTLAEMAKVALERPRTVSEGVL